MPIRRDSISGIISAYAKGLEIAQERENEITRQKEKRETLKIETDRYNQEQKLRQERQKIEDERFQSAMDIAAAMRKHQIASQNAEQFSKIGVAPPGYKEIGRESLPIGEGQAGVKVKFGAQGDQNLNPEFSAPDPETMARQQANINAIIKAPEYQNQLRLKQLEEEAKAKQKEEDYIQQSVARRENNQLRLDIARMNNASREEVAELRRKIDEDKLLSPAEAEIFNVPYGTTKKEAFGKMPGVKLTPAQSNDISDLEDAENKLLALKKELDPKLGGVGYDTYFKGASYEGATLESRRRAGANRDAKLQKITPIIADYEAAIAKNRAGTSFTTNEQKLLESYTVSPSHLNNPGDAEALINTALKGIQNLRAIKYKQFTNRVLQKDGSQNTEKVIEYNADGTRK